MTTATASLGDATLDQLLQLNPALAQYHIRVDQETQKGSVIDVIRLVTGCSSSNSQNELRRLLLTNLELGEKCTSLRINGKGKLTPVADPESLMMIAHLLPGKRLVGPRAIALVKASKLKRKFTTLMETGKVEFATQKKHCVQLELSRAVVSDQRGRTLAEYDYLTNATPSTIEAMELADTLFPDDDCLYQAAAEPVPVRVGVVYFLRLEGTDMVKVGYSSNLLRRISTLQTACPWNLLLEHVHTTPHCAQLEKVLHVALAPARVRGEWFHLPSDYDYGRLLSDAQAGGGPGDP